MKISTKGRYGLRLMVDLAVHYEQGLVPLKEIAVRQEISEKYLEQIMMQLNRCLLYTSGGKGESCSWSLCRFAGKIQMNRGHRRPDPGKPAVT